MRDNSRTGLLIGITLAVFTGMFIGALGTTVLLRTSIGSAGDLKARDTIRLHAMIAGPAGLVPADESRARTVSAFAASFISATAALDSTAALDDRQRIVDIAHWVDSSGALTGRDDGGTSAWAEAAARCVVAMPDTPRDAAKCVKAATPPGYVAPVGL